MKNLAIKVLLAAGAMAVSATSFGTTMYLNQYGQRAGSGTLYRMIYDGSDGDVASNATWDFTGGVLSQTGGTLRANQRIGSAPGPSSSWLLTDVVTGLSIDTGASTTTASSYNCIEQPFGATTAASCYNSSVGFNSTIESTVDYNVGGNASCEERTIGGDDVAGSGNVFRGLRSWDGTGCAGAGSDSNNTGRGALDAIHILQNSGGVLILANWNGTLTNDQAIQCVNTGSASAIDPTGFCGRAHWLVFSNTVPVPAAAWLFGSALGLLGWVRRRALA